MSVKLRPYLGCQIQPSTSPHWRWTALVDGHGFCYANSLTDMRDLIRSKVGRT